MEALHNVLFCVASLPSPDGHFYVSFSCTASPWKRIVWKAHENWQRAKVYGQQHTVWTRLSLWNVLETLITNTIGVSTNFQFQNSILFQVGIHVYPAKYLLFGQIAVFFTICICIRPETFLLSVSVSGQQNANRNRYLNKNPRIPRLFAERVIRWSVRKYYVHE